MNILEIMKFISENVRPDSRLLFKSLTGDSEDVLYESRDLYFYNEKANESYSMSLQDMLELIANDSKFILEVK